MILQPIMIDFAINFLAGIAGLLVVLWIERQRRPILSMKVGAQNRLDETDPFSRSAATWLYIQVCNESMPRWLAWVYNREPATTCQAWITFHRSDGERVFAKEMLARWADTAEPVIATVEAPIDRPQSASVTAAPAGYLTPSTREQVYVRLQAVNTTIDIPAGESTNLDVVMRFKGEEGCYGWNNDSYLYSWRHPSWVLANQVYIASVKVKSGGRQFQDAFQIINDVPYDSFRLEPLDRNRKRQLAAKLFGGPG